MSKIRLDALDDSQYDILKEIGNIGAGNATTALAKLIDTKIDMSVPQVSLVPFSGIADAFGSEETILVGILLGLEGEISGMMMFLLDEPSAHILVNILMGHQIDYEGPFTEIEQSAISEIGNIIAGAYLSALSELTRMKIYPTVPSIAIDMVGALLSVPAIEYGMIGDKVLLIQTKFGEDELINGYFVMVPELDSYDKILSSLGI